MPRLTLLILIFVFHPAIGQTPQNQPLQAVVANDPASPLQITSIAPAPLPSNLPPQLASRSVAFRVTVTNGSSKDVLAYAINYVFEDSSGAQLTNVCFDSQSYDPTKPMIAASQTTVLHPSFARRPEVVRVRAVFDLALLADGTFYGANVCRSLNKYQVILRDRRAFEAFLLKYLETNGAQESLEMLRTGLARENTTDPPLLNARKLTPSR